MLCGQHECWLMYAGACSLSFSISERSAAIWAGGERLSRLFDNVQWVELPLAEDLILRTIYRKSCNDPRKISRYIIVLCFGRANDRESGTFSSGRIPEP